MPLMNRCVGKAALISSSPEQNHACYPSNSMHESISINKI